MKDKNLRPKVKILGVQCPLFPVPLYLCPLYPLCPSPATRLKLYLAGGITFTFTPLDTRKPVVSKQTYLGGRRRYTVLDDHITTRASSKADLGRYCTLLVACKRTSSDFYGKRTNFSFDKAENTETVYMYVLHIDPRVVFSRCRRSIGRLDGTVHSDNAGVVSSVAGRR